MFRIQAQSSWVFYFSHAFSAGLEHRQRGHSLRKNNCPGLTRIALQIPCHKRHPHSLFVDKPGYGIQPVWTGHPNSLNSSSLVPLTSCSPPPQLTHLFLDSFSLGINVSFEALHFSSRQCVPIQQMWTHQTSSHSFAASAAGQLEQELPTQIDLKGSIQCFPTVDQN